MNYCNARGPGGRGRRGRAGGLFYGSWRFAALYAVGADQRGAHCALQYQLLLLKVGLEDPFCGPVRVTVGVSGDRAFSANSTFVGHVEYYSKSGRELSLRVIFLAKYHQTGRPVLYLRPGLQRKL